MNIEDVYREAMSMHRHYDTLSLTAVTHNICHARRNSSGLLEQFLATPERPRFG
ncbi:hypothetical protein OKW35_000941 [Paraburkholderia sp. MM5477-R1]